jgi:hypothetical protein
VSEPTTATLTTTEQDGRTDFDFFVGNWNGHHWRLRERLKGSSSWEEFDSTTVARRLLGGLGNMDEITLQRESGPREGLTVRLFDPSSKVWRLYWTTGGAIGPLDVPMVGAFKNGRGEFYAQEVFEDKSIISRYIWCNITPTSCRWEQAFSPDGGATWETNWVTEFVRVE